MPHIQLSNITKYLEMLLLVQLDQDQNCCIINSTECLVMAVTCLAMGCGRGLFSLWMKAHDPDSSVPEQMVEKLPILSEIEHTGERGVVLLWFAFSLACQFQILALSNQALRKLHLDRHLRFICGGEK